MELSIEHAKIIRSLLTKAMEAGAYDNIVMPNAPGRMVDLLNDGIKEAN